MEIDCTQSENATRAVVPPRAATKEFKNENFIAKPS